jgi:hypothetical protein
LGKVKKAGAARKKRKKKKAAEVEPSTFAATELDPIKKCGPGTSVQLLYRVNETAGKAVRPHLVFFDRHGWYCEHGRDCPAVAHARRDAKKHHGNLVLAYDKLGKTDRLKTVG